MNGAIIRTILRERLLDVAEVPTIQWQGVAFTKPATMYLSEDFRAGTTSTVANGTNSARPLYLLDLHTPPDTDPAAIDTLGAALENAFQAGRTLTDDAATHQLEITSFNPGAVVTMPNGWGYRRITVGMTAWAFRTSLQT